MTQEEYRDTVRACRDGFSGMELSLAKDDNSNKKGFYRNIISKIRNKENAGVMGQTI